MKALGILFALALTSSALNENIAQVVIGSDTVTIIIKADNNLVLDLDNQENNGIGNTILSLDTPEFISNGGSLDETTSLVETQTQMKSNDFTVTFPTGDSVTVSTSESSESEESSETAFLQQPSRDESQVYFEDLVIESESVEDSESETDSTSTAFLQQGGFSITVSFGESSDSTEESESSTSEESGDYYGVTITFGESADDGELYESSTSEESVDITNEEVVYMASEETDGNSTETAGNSTETDGNSTETDGNSTETALSSTETAENFTETSENTTETAFVQDDGLAITITFGGSDDESVSDSAESESEADSGLAITITFGDGEDSSEESESVVSSEETAFVQGDLNNEKAPFLVAVNEDSTESESSSYDEYYGVADLFAEESEGTDSTVEVAEESSVVESLSDLSEVTPNEALGLLEKIEELEFMLNQIMEQQKVATFLSLNNQESSKA